MTSRVEKAVPARLLKKGLDSIIRWRWVKVADANENINGRGWSIRLTSR
jgi:hypothetical protein